MHAEMPCTLPPKPSHDGPPSGATLDVAGAGAGTGAEGGCRWLHEAIHPSVTRTDSQTPGRMSVSWLTCNGGASSPDAVVFAESTDEVVAMLAGAA